MACGCDVILFGYMLFGSTNDQILGLGFKNETMHRSFDEKLSGLTTNWCCRSPKDQVGFHR